MKRKISSIAASAALLVLLLVAAALLIWKLDPAPDSGGMNNVTETRQYCRGENTVAELNSTAERLGPASEPSAASNVPSRIAHTPILRFRAVAEGGDPLVGVPFECYWSDSSLNTVLREGTGEPLESSHVSDRQGFWDVSVPPGIGALFVEVADEAYTKSIAIHNFGRLARFLGLADHDPRSGFLFNASQVAAMARSNQVHALHLEVATELMLVIRFEDDEEFEGRVTWRSTGSTGEEADVPAYLTSATMWGMGSVSCTAGLARIERLPVNQRFAITVNVDRPGWRSQRFMVQTGPTTTSTSHELVLTLRSNRPELRLALDHNGLALSETVTVSIVDEEGLIFEELKLQGPGVTSSRNLFPRRVVFVRAWGAAHYVSDKVELHPNQPHTIRLTPSAGSSVSALLVDENRKPLQHAVLEVAGPIVFRQWHRLPRLGGCIPGIRAWSGADGAVSLNNLPDGQPVKLVAHAKGRKKSQVMATPSGDLGEIVLTACSEAGSVELRLPNPEPELQYTVHLFLPGGSSARPRRQVAGDALVRWDDLEPGTYSLFVQRVGEATGWPKNVVVEAGEIHETAIDVSIPQK